MYSKHNMTCIIVGLLVSLVVLYKSRLQERQEMCDSQKINLLFILISIAALLHNSAYHVRCAQTVQCSLEVVQ